MQNDTNTTVTNTTPHFFPWPILGPITGLLLLAIIAFVRDRYVYGTWFCCCCRIPEVPKIPKIPKIRFFQHPLSFTTAVSRPQPHDGVRRAYI